MKVLVTGANGKIGVEVMHLLVNSGYKVLGVDKDVSNLKEFDHKIVDTLHEGQVYQTLNHFDAVIHLASYPRPGIVPDTITFQNNVNSLYNVLNSCYNLNINKIIIASSMAVYGFRYSDDQVHPKYFPVDEMHPTNPIDAYGLSKLVGEQIAYSFAFKSKIRIISFRIPQVVVNYNDFEYRSNSPDLNKQKLWLYIDVRDVANAFKLALESNITGHEVINISAQDTDQSTKTLMLINKYFPNAKIHKEYFDYDNISPLNINKASTLINFRPKFSWRNNII